MLRDRFKARTVTGVVSGICIRLEKPSTFGNVLVGEQEVFRVPDVNSSGMHLYLLSSN